jgi:hypothetical protein
MLSSPAAAGIPTMVAAALPDVVNIVLGWDEKEMSNVVGWKTVSSSHPTISMAVSSFYPIPGC